MRGGALRLDAEVAALHVLANRHDDAIRGAEPGERGVPRIGENGSRRPRAIGGPDQEVAGARRVDRDEVEHDRLRLGSAVQEAWNGTAAVRSSLALWRVEVRPHDVEENRRSGHELSCRARRQRVHDAARLDGSVDERWPGRALRLQADDTNELSWHSSSRAGRGERVPLFSPRSQGHLQPRIRATTGRHPLAMLRSLMSISRIFASQSNFLLHGHQTAHDMTFHDSIL